MYLLHHPHTLLTPIFGVFTLALSENNQIPDIHFIIMKSVFDPNLIADHQKMSFFDLKGSSYGRRTLKPEEYHEVRDMRTCRSSLLSEALKDIDFENIFSSLNLENCEALISQINNDADFLSKNNFMDYSLLMFIVFDYGENMEDPDKWTNLEISSKSEETQNKNFKSRLPKVNGKSSFKQILTDDDGFEYERYIYFGVIDYLTSFGYMKKFEEQFRQTYSRNSS